jgi:universal stress protein A
MNRVTGKSATAVKGPPNGGRANVVSSAAKIVTSLRIKSILVPIDFSIQSKKALQYALSLAKQVNASVTLLHVVHPKCTALGRASDIAFEDELRRGGARQLNALVQRFLGDEVPCDLIVRIGSPAVEILHTAQRLNADLIVISTHGRTGLKHLLLGSVAEAVVRHSPCPVLVVRNRQPGFHDATDAVAAKRWSAIPKDRVGTCGSLRDIATETKNRV